MSDHAPPKRVLGVRAGPRNRTGTGSRRLSRGEVAWEIIFIFISVFLFVFGGLAFVVKERNKALNKKSATWEVQTLPVKDDEVMCYILTTPKGAVDLECLPYHYEVEENQDEQHQTRI